jgi:hypothetical protein
MHNVAAGTVEQPDSVGGELALPPAVLPTPKMRMLTVAVGFSMK